MAAVRYLYKLLNYSTMKKKFKKEEMQFENELLKLKASAEFGAAIHSEGTAPPEIENQFLKNVFEFERAWKDMKTVKVFDFIGKPEIKKIRTTKTTVYILINGLIGRHISVPNPLEKLAAIR